MRSFLAGGAGGGGGSGAGPAGASFETGVQPGDGQILITTVPGTCVAPIAIAPRFTGCASTPSAPFRKAKLTA
jgi:hypothetical protein